MFISHRAVQCNVNLTEYLHWFSAVYKCAVVVHCAVFLFCRVQDRSVQCVFQTKIDQGAADGMGKYADQHGN